MEKKLDIVFMSEERGSGTTANMHAVAQLCFALQKRERERGRPKWQQTKLRFFDGGMFSMEERKLYFERADLIIVNLRQSDESFQSYFMKKQKYQEKSMYLISRYQKESLWSRQVMQRRYRMPENRLGVIPQNHAYASAYEQGRAKQFLRKLSDKDLQKIERVEMQEFTKEVEQTARQLLQFLEDCMENSLILRM